MNDYKNKIELVGYYGGDETHALSAWTSTSRDLTEEKRGRIPNLLKTLAANGHETPFEKSYIHFLATTDIATHIQLLKHRIGVSVNGESARYKELKDDKFYVPIDWDEEERSLYIHHMEEALHRYHETLARLVAKGVPRKRAKESARLYLPYGNQLTQDISFNFRSFMHLQRLRYTTHAQLEVCNLAREAVLAVMNLPGNPFQYSLEAFGIVRNGNLMTPSNAGPNVAFGPLDETVFPIVLSEGSNACE
jgi:flavin-dependent thymidylate synthase